MWDLDSVVYYIFKASILIWTVLLLIWILNAEFLHGCLVDVSNPSDTSDAGTQPDCVQVLEIIVSLTSASCPILVHFLIHWRKELWMRRRSCCMHPCLGSGGWCMIKMPCTSICLVVPANTSRSEPSGVKRSYISHKKYNKCINVQINKRRWRLFERWFCKQQCWWVNRDEDSKQEWNIKSGGVKLWNICDFMTFMCIASWVT